MTRYIMKRLLVLIPVLLCVSFLVFGILNLMPGEVASIQLGMAATPEGIEQWNAEHGMNDPFIAYRQSREILVDKPANQRRIFSEDTLYTRINRRFFNSCAFDWHPGRNYLCN